MLLARPRVDAPLAAALATQRLVLVSAPAGYGKSALMARQLQAVPAGTALAWMAADAGDDLPRLLECLVAALEPHDLPWRTAPECQRAGHRAATADRGRERRRGRHARGDRAAAAGPVHRPGPPRALDRRQLIAGCAAAVGDAATLHEQIAVLEATDGAAATPVTPSAIPTASVSALSSRELEVLERIAAGDSNKLIARAFDLSPHTVKRHVANILDKLALDSRGRATAWYRENAASQLRS